MSPTPVASATLHSSPSEHDARVLAEQVRVLYANARTGILATVINASIAYAIMLPVAPAPLFSLWFAFLLVVAAGRYADIALYRRAAASPAKNVAGDEGVFAVRWLRRFTLGALLSGSSWGVLGAWFLQTATVEYQVLITILMIGFAAGGIAFFSVRWQVYLAFMLPILLPFSLVLLFNMGNPYNYIGLMALLFIAILVPASRHLNKVMLGGILHQFASDALAAKVSKSNAELAARQVELQSEIGARIATQAAMIASNDRLQMHFQQNPLAVIEWDAGLRITDWNPAAQKIFGYTAEQMIGRDGIDHIVAANSRNQARALWGSILRKKTTAPRFIFSNLRENGTTITCEWFVTPLIDTRGEVVSIVGLAEDISRHAELERMKNEFISTVNHELRTPLTSIMGTLSLLKEEVVGKLTPAQKKLLAIASDNSEQLQQLLGNMLDLESVGSNKMTLNLGDIGAQALLETAVIKAGSIVKHLHGRCEILPDADALALHVDNEKIVKVVAHLISNAAKFSPANSPITLAFEQRGGAVRLSVSDRGSGVPPDFRDRIFNKFAQADSADTRAIGGTGLGLAMCKAIAEQHGGSIGFHDREGGGSVFYLDLPVDVRSHAPRDARSLRPLLPTPPLVH